MKFLVILISSLLLNFSAAHAAALTDADKADIRQVEIYMNALTTAKARFTQTNADGSVQPGTFYLNRPGKVRFEYDDPIDDFIVADGVFIYFYDAELKEQTNAPIGNTLADFILRDKIKLSGDIAVLGVTRDAGLLNIKIAQAKDEAAGTLTLTFTQNPFALKQWTVLDAQGATTSVALSNVATGIEFPYSLFVYADPKTGKATYNK